MISIFINFFFYSIFFLIRSFINYILNFLFTHILLTEQEGEKSIIDAINEEQLKRIQSLTKELEETDKLDVEASTKSLSSENSKKDKIAADGKGDVKTLSAASEHYLKTDDKDITSFQENDTVTAHSKVSINISY